MKLGFSPRGWDLGLETGMSKGGGMKKEKKKKKENKAK